MINLPNIDLNLLKLFAVLWETGSVSATAERLSLSQSACSHALTRLRDRLQDDLFIRVGNKMIPTEKAEALAQTVLPAIRMLESGLIQTKGFDEKDTHVFRIAATDYTSWCLRPFIAFMSQNWSSVHFEFVQLGERLPADAMKQGELDFVCGFDHQHDLKTEGIEQICWFEDRYVSARCGSQAHHPFSFEYFLERKHILVAPWNESRGIVDLSLARLKKKRQIAIKTASVLAAPYFVPHTSYLLSIPDRYAKQVQTSLNLDINDLPLPVPTYKLMLYWHKTRENSERTRWFLKNFQTFHTGSSTSQSEA